MTTLTLPARDRAQLTCARVRVDRGGRTVLHDVEMKVSPGSRWGVVGENGRGKSTLSYVLAGLLTPDGGTVHRVGTLALAEQEMPVEDERTVGDFIDEHLADARAALRADERTVGDFIDEHLADARAALRALDTAAEALAAEHPGGEQAYADALEAARTLDAWDADRRVDVALDGLGAVSDRTRLLATLSVGRRYRIRLACLLGAEYDFLLLDEPTNHLSIALVDELTEALHSTDAAVVVATHDRQMRRDISGWPHLALAPRRQGEQGRPCPARA
ncbi:ATP-binding cassette domain-containing protein [Streptomyces caelestis]|uniref:ATP-binding cassette domain-containing protein n=1 Tax=Streptomyces caelestis TaxID=36816 RepID=UPI0036F640CE